MRKMTDFLEKAKEVLNGKRFEDLGKREKQAIFDAFLEAEISYE